MDWHGPQFVLLITAICTGAWLINNWIRARHGYSVSDDWGRNITREDPQAARQLELLSTENEQLTGKIERLEERLAVLERIATDPAGRTYADIEALRDR